MPGELRELRARITVEADAVLDTLSKATNRDRSDIAREVLHKWAIQMATFSTLCRKRFVVEGIAAEEERRESGES